MEIIGSIILSIAHSILFYDKVIGISMLAFEILFNGIMCYILHKKNKIQNKTGILLMIPILLLSSTYFIFANRTFYMANLFIIIVLNLLMYIILTNRKKFLTNYLHTTWKLLVDTITGFKEGIDLTKQKSREHVQVNEKYRGNLKKIATSLLIVFAVVGVVLILLSSADMIFANLFSGIGDFLKNIDIGTPFNIAWRLLLIVIAYILFLSLTLKLQKEYIIDEKELKNSNGKYAFTIKLLLISLNIVYLVFCFIQIQSLFAKVNLNDTFDYANYARRGFFQLMFVSFINFGIILISNKYNEKNETIIKLLNSLLVLFTIIIALSSMYRMYMYETEYGLTYLRAFVYMILITEILEFIPIMIYIFNKRFDFLKWCFAIAICTYCIANYINIEKTIVSKNINRQTERPIDYKYIGNISSADSLEILIEKYEKGNLTEREELNLLNIMLKIVSDTQELSWQEFNISKYKMLEKNINKDAIKERITELKNDTYLEQRVSEILSKNPESFIYDEIIN